MKVRLWDQLPSDFDPRRIDTRLYADKKVTLIGLRLMEPSDPIFAFVDSVLKEMQCQIKQRPGIENFSARELSTTLKIGEAEVARAMREFGLLGNLALHGIEWVN